MINYINKALFNDDSVDKQLTLTFSGGDVITNEDIDAESMRIVESINSGSELTFGSCEASELEITIRNVYSSHVGQTVTVSVVLNGDTAHPFTFGTYTVVEDKATADRKKREIHAYDSLYEVLNADVSGWYNTLYPTSSTTKTIKQIRDSFFSYFGITQQSVTLPNDTITVGKTISPTTLSGKDVLFALCEINARFGHIGRDGVFNYIRLQEMITGLYPRNDLYPDDDLYPSDEVGSEDIGISGNYISANYEEYTVDKIDKLVIRQEDSDIGCIVGSGTNAYIIQGNFLVYGKNATDLTAIANNIKDQIFAVWYRPCEVELRGNPCLEVGDGIRLNTSYEIVYSYIFKRTLSGIQFLRDDFYADGLKKRNEQVNSVNFQIKQLAGKTASIKADVDGIETEVSDLAQQTSTAIQQLSDSVAVKVNSQGHIVSQLDVSTNGMAFSGDKVVFNTNNFVLDANGNATFSGNVTGANVSGGAITGSRLTTSDNQTSDNGIIIDEGSIYTTNGGLSTMSFDPLGFVFSGYDRWGVLHKVEMALNLEDAPGVGAQIEISYGGSSCTFKASGVSYAESAGEADVAYEVASTNVYPSLTAAGNVDLHGGTNAATPTWCANTFEPLSSSDRRLKDNIKEVTENDLKILEKIKIYFFTFKGKESDGLTHCGVMAQDVLSAMKELGIDVDKQSIVEEYETRSYMDERELCGEKAYRVNYKELSNLLLFAWQHDHERLNSLEDRISRLEVKQSE